MYSLREWYSKNKEMGNRKRERTLLRAKETLAPEFVALAGLTVERSAPELAELVHELRRLEFLKSWRLGTKGRRIASSIQFYTGGSDVLVPKNEDEHDYKALVKAHLARLKQMVGEAHAFKYRELGQSSQIC